jgi:hypothetical protein
MVVVCCGGPAQANLAKLEAEAVLRSLSSGDTTGVRASSWRVKGEGAVGRERPELNELLELYLYVSDLSWREAGVW